MLIGLAAGLAIAGTISCLGTSALGRKGAASAESSEVQSHRLRLYLYLSSAILVTGILMIYGWLQWPEFLVRDAEAYQALTQALLLYFGINYSLIIFSFYVPVALFLADKASAPHGEDGPAAIARFASVPDAFRTVLALLAPFLTAALSPLIGDLLG